MSAPEQEKKYDNSAAIESREASPVSPTSESGRGDVKWDSSTMGEANPNPIAAEQRDRRLSNEWDASKTPPSRFQKRKGSIHATPPSRDGHVERNKKVPGVSKQWFPGFFSNK